MGYEILVSRSPAVKNDSLNEYEPLANFIMYVH